MCFFTVCSRLSCWRSVDWRDYVELSALAILPEIFWKNKPAWIKSNSPFFFFTNARWLDQIYLPDSGGKEDFVGVEFTCVRCHREHRELEISKQTSWGRKIRRQRCEDREQSRGLNRLNTEVKLRDVCTHGNTAQRHTNRNTTVKYNNTTARKQLINQQLN